MTPAEKAAPVSQGDREAAAKCHEKSCYEIVRIQGVQCRNGYADGDYLVQAFARHRLASEAAIRAETAGEIARLREALESYSDDVHCGMCECEVSSGALARAALADSTTEQGE